MPIGCPPVGYPCRWSYRWFPRRGSGARVPTLASVIRTRRRAEVLRGRRDAPAHTGNGDGIELLLEFTNVRGRLREAQSLQRIAALSRVQESLARLSCISSVSALIDRAPEEVCHLGFDRAI